MGSVGKNWSENRHITAAEHLTCLSGPFRDARCLLEEVRHCGLADFQIIGSVRLRRHKNLKLKPVINGGHVNMRF